MKISRKRRILVSSFITMLFSLVTFSISTFAWFSDSVSSLENIIKVGNLDVEMYWSEDLNSNEWFNIEDPAHNEVFSHDNYEPGYTDLKYLKIVNAGSLAFKYDLSLLALGEVGELAEVVDVYYLHNATTNIAYRDLSTMTKKGTIKETLGKTLSGVQTLLPSDSDNAIYHKGEIVVGIALQMQTTAGNEYQGKSIGDGFSIKLTATQYGYEEDSFGSDYDKDATLPSSGVSISVSTTNNKVDKETSVSSGLVDAYIPAGVEVEDGVKSLTLTVTEMDDTQSNVILEGDQKATSLDVHIDGISESNTVPMIVSISSVASKYLNKGNIDLYHVENGQTIQMTEVDSVAELTAHNQFYYDPATGTFTLALASFSEVRVIEETLKGWEGNVDHNWYNADAEELIIYNADQLWSLSQIVGGMAYDENTKAFIQDNFEGQKIKLIADINLGDNESKNNPNVVFYPIGYYNNAKSYKRVSGKVTVDGNQTSVSSNVTSFKGTFNGNGHTISNFYQNTWEMFGDYNDGYTGTPNYYKDGMGLFGYVNGGTVENLTIENFSSDGEFTPTGVVAAYAHNATFKNISIKKCNPRVYNTGNGGIIGIAGNSDDTEDEKGILLQNITVDNSNKISALWGSWDVACGGLVGMYRGKGGIHFNDCHVSAQIDVNNDVCANYQYYAYRYAGMVIGSVRENVTDKETGRVYPNMDGITAENCTVHYSTWNNYFYCELVENSLASYTHDHQMSRLTEINSVSEIQDEKGNWNKTGNFIVVTYDKDEKGNIKVDENGDDIVLKSVCYHIRKDADGNFYRHLHQVYNEDGTPNKEYMQVVDGKEVWIEDKQCLYLPFGQLVTGYSWGVTSKGIDDVDGVELMDKVLIGSITKFDNKAFTSITNPGTKIELGDLFAEADLTELISSSEKLTKNPDSIKIRENNIQVGVTYVAYDGATREVDVKLVKDGQDWTKWYFVLPADVYGHLEKGAVYVTIQDYVYCTPTTAKINLAVEDKFVSKFTNTNFTYRVGNEENVSLGTLFALKNGSSVNSNNVTVTITNVKGNASGTFTAEGSDWTKGKIDFNGTGQVIVTISEPTSKPVELKLDVINAVNATTATSATTKNVVLLQDCGFSSLEVSGGYTLYGNGFTMTCASDSTALDTGYAFVNLNNGTLDNVQIVLPNFDYAVLYKSNMTESGNRSETTDRTRYYNVKSGVMSSGDSQILNSRISGARAAVNVSSGNLIIDNSQIELGAVANILVGAANSLTLRDVTLLQKPTASTYDPNKTLMGFSVLILCNNLGDSTPINLEGTLIQNAWVDENDKQYVPSAGQSVVTNVLKNTDFTHDLDGNGQRESLNLGFAYMPENVGGKVNATSINDNRTDIAKAQSPYDFATVSYSGSTTYVYSYKYKDSESIPTGFTNTGTYLPNRYSDIILVNYSDTADGLTTKKSFGPEGWIYELNVDLDKLSVYKLDFSKLYMNINGDPITDFKVNGDNKPTNPVAVTAGGVTYTLTATVNGKECTAYFKVTGTETTKESPSLVASNYEAALLVGEAGNTLNKDTWHGAAPALQGIQIKYWSVAEKQYKTIRLSDYTPTTAGKQNGNNTTWTFTPANGDFTLTLTGGQVHSGNKVSAMPVVFNGKLYFVAAASNGLVNYGNDARTIPVSYSFKDNNGGTELTFSHTWSIECPDKATAYDYSDFCNGTSNTFTIKSSNGNSCFTADTLITLADGSQVRVDSLTGNEELLVWNHSTGSLESAKIGYIVNHDGVSQNILVNKLYFSDGNVVKVIGEHVFFDSTLNKYITINYDNVADYVGHEFVSLNGNELEYITLDSYIIEEEYTQIYEVVTDKHLTCFTEGVLSASAYLDKLLNVFEINEETLSYDLEQVQADIEKYGLYTYADFEGLIDEKAFEMYNGAYLKVAVGKGYITWDEILELIDIYYNVEVQPLSE